MSRKQYYRACLEGFVYIALLPPLIGWWTLAVFALHFVYNLATAKGPQ